ncbi:hypothetical protein MIS46_00620 [Wielerella bovis]|uniref:hypothetical protein n=1 Tax=Wielerella bovis TaxID=2917790 RepID=UPI002018B894|nr:hypothetical protein [Wielerella bovis]ULJ62637.1 hypothetical protein MIS46_00620 [Wielerella bovis]
MNIVELFDWLNLSVSGVITGLCLWIKHIFDTRLATEQQKEITKLEQRFQQLLQDKEHFHRISQQTYQQMFQKKVETYDQLLQVKHQLYVFENENSMWYLYGGDDMFVEYESFIKQLIRITQLNKLHISNELDRKFMLWQTKWSAVVQRFEEIEIMVECQDNLSFEDEIERKGEAIKHFFENHHELFDDFMQQIDTDIDKEIKIRYTTK